jgi:hypothetical protein
VLVPAALGAKIPAGGHTDAGMAAADRALIGVRNLGAGWTAGPAGGIERLGCSATTPAAIVETGTATSPTFEASSAGPFVSQAAFVYETEAQARSMWSMVAGPATFGCLAKSVAGAGAKGVRFEIVHRNRLSRSAAGSRSYAYRIMLRAITKDQKVNAYVDLVLLERGSALTALSFAGFAEPVATSLELTAVRAASTRLG